LTVIIDVFRAFSVTYYVYANGIERIIPVAEVEQARQIKAWHPDYALIGERNGRRLPGFDYGNSLLGRGYKKQTVDLRLD
jgi:2-phosphosulfolactate phosphatase